MFEATYTLCFLDFKINTQYCKFSITQMYCTEIGNYDSFVVIAFTIIAHAFCNRNLSFIPVMIFKVTVFVVQKGKKNARPAVLTHKLVVIHSMHKCLHIIVKIR